MLGQQCSCASESPRCRLLGEYLALMESFNPLTFERTGSRCIYWKTSNSNIIISVLLPVFYQLLCGGAPELCVNAMYLRNKGWVEWPLQMQMSGIFKALGFKDHKAGLRLLLYFPSLSIFFLLQERGWHNWESGSVRFSGENTILRRNYNSRNS